MIKNDMTIKMGGEAGQGVESSGQGFARALTRGGLYVFGLQDYMSRIRGGYNFFGIRISEQPRITHVRPVELLLAFSPDAITEHLGEIPEGGAVISDERLKVDAEALSVRGVQHFPFPLQKMATDIGGNKIMANTAAIGAAAGVTEYPFERIAQMVEENFGKRKGAEIAEANLKVARAAYDYALENYATKYGWKLAPTDDQARMMINGNQAFCIGAVAAGCKFISAYPMTPASSIIEWMSAHAAKFGIVTKQTEDEISAILMAIGANHVGVRAMTATSGGGFSLMVEALGMAGMTETPLVVVEAQRAGPSTGMPTRTEQADLLFVVFASQGEFPRFLIAPSTLEEYYQTGIRAFNLAEKYQTPVIVLSDMNLATSFRTMDEAYFDQKEVKIDRGKLLTEKDLDAMADDYKRHLITEDGISPRALHGSPKAVFPVTSDEHDEWGHMQDEDPEIRVQQVDKRARKFEKMRQEMRAPKLYGPKDADITLVGWGSTYGAIREATERLNQSGTNTSHLHFSDIWPWPEEKAQPLVDRAKFMVCIENNSTGQFAHLLRAMTGRKVDAKILKYNGRPFSPEEILERLKEEVKVPALA